MTQFFLLFLLIISQLLNALQHEKQQIFTDSNKETSLNSYIIKKLLVMWDIIERLPVDLAANEVLPCLELHDRVCLERACLSRKSHQLFLQLISASPPAMSYFNTTMAEHCVLHWINKTRCKIRRLYINVPNRNISLSTDLNVSLLKHIDLTIDRNCSMDNIHFMVITKCGYKVRKLYICGTQKVEVINTLCKLTPNASKLVVELDGNYETWLTGFVLSSWPLVSVTVTGHSSVSRDSAIVAVAENCPQLQKLKVQFIHFTYISILALSEHSLPLRKLDIAYNTLIPNIPKSELVHCAYALSRIQELSTRNLLNNAHAWSYLTGICELSLTSPVHCYATVLPFASIHLHTLKLFDITVKLADMLTIVRAQSCLLDVFVYYNICLTDTALLELAKACPQLRLLELSYETSLTDTGVLALSQHCPHLRVLDIHRCKQHVTEAAILQLLQCCPKLMCLNVSRCSLSADAWARLVRRSCVHMEDSDSSSNISSTGSSGSNRKGSEHYISTRRCSYCCCS